MRKFNVGDKVRCTKRCPIEFKFSGTKKIIDTYYDTYTKHVLYNVTRKQIWDRYYSYDLEKA